MTVPDNDALIRRLVNGTAEFTIIYPYAHGNTWCVSFRIVPGAIARSTIGSSLHETLKDATAKIPIARAENEDYMRRVQAATSERPRTPRKKASAGGSLKDEHKKRRRRISP